jgi:hypothetical protein
VAVVAIDAGMSNMITVVGILLLWWVLQRLMNVLDGIVQEELVRGIVIVENPLDLFLIHVLLISMTDS